MNIFRIAALAILGLYHTTASAQSTFGYVGFEWGIPLGEWSSTFALAPGLTVGTETPVSEKWSITSMAGYTRLLTNDSRGTNYPRTLNFLPVMLGGKYSFTGVRQRFYVMGQVGANFAVYRDGEDNTYRSGVTYAFELGRQFSETVALSLRGHFYNLPFDAVLDDNANKSILFIRLVSSFPKWHKSGTAPSSFQ